MQLAQWEVGRYHSDGSIQHRRQHLAITANAPFSQWGEIFVDAAMTVAAVDRLVHHATILEMNVQSYRRRTAQAAQAPSRRAKPTATTADPA
jgi:hypothetical protein